MSRKSRYDRRERKSKVYGEKVMKKISRNAISWAIDETRSSRENGHGYSGYVENEIQGRRRVQNLNIYEINKQLTADEQRQVLRDVLDRIQDDSVEDEMEQYSSRQLRKRKQTREEALVLDSLEEQGKGKTIKQLRKHQILFTGLPYEAQYILAKRALLYEIGKRNELLKDKDARKREEKRLAAAREAQEARNREHEREMEEKWKEDEINFLVHQQTTGISRNEWEFGR